MIVYTKPSCVQCSATTRKASELGIEPDARPLADHPEALELAREHGISSAPIVVAGGKVWGGYRPDLIKEYATALIPV